MAVTMCTSPNLRFGGGGAPRLLDPRPRRSGAMGQAWSRCTCLMTEKSCDDCSGTGVCRHCDGKGYIEPKHDIEVFSYILDKKGAYRDVKEPPKACKHCGGWGGTPIFRGITHSVAPSSAMCEGTVGRVSCNGAGNGRCRTCKGTGKVLVQPEWMRQQIDAATPKFEVAGGLVTSPQKAGPLRVSTGQKLLMGNLD